ncbi:MAG: potassium-transporting ATPase subunit F [Gammaproteobacteria bacterium]|nr:potassium-transporting ATPase subunit F [Pseudomonadota bacterium]QOJ23010.1 MAG: potassium-transporting ATPase subunit F [Gammaproteobacteria bacterium]
MSWIYWLACTLAVLIFIYLLYALFNAEEIS